MAAGNYLAAMFQSRKVRLKPNKAQAKFIYQNFGASRFYPSSQLCSHCGARNKEMKNLNRRTFTCPVCGASLDRDLNAAINIDNFCTHGEWGTGNKANDRGDSSSAKKRYSLSSVANR